MVQAFPTELHLSSLLESRVQGLVGSWGAGQGCALGVTRGLVSYGDKGQGLVPGNPGAVLSTARLSACPSKGFLLPPDKLGNGGLGQHMGHCSGGRPSILTLHHARLSCLLPISTKQSWWQPSPSGSCLTLPRMSRARCSLWWTASTP